MAPDETPRSETESKTPAAAPAAQPAAPPAWRGWALFAAALVGTFVLGLLAASIISRRIEAERQPPREPIDAMETDSSRWAVNYPREYNRYRMTATTGTKTKYGGSYQWDYLEQTPANVILFAGYPFSKAYLQARGHQHDVEDVAATERISAKSPATCWTCKSPDVLREMVAFGPATSIQDLGQEQVAKFYALPFDHFRGQKDASGGFVHEQGKITHPIGCLDCHEPSTMRLTITRPALREAFQRRGMDLSKVSHQEMRSLVCAQCHVEYYFRTDKEQGLVNYLTFPWKEGTQIEKIETYYEGVGFSDWTHAISKAPMLKMQHPDYEIYLTGVHAARNVSCADCHMPYRTEGGVKFTDHFIQSPLLNIENSCAVCHRWSEDDLRQRVEGIQDKVREARDRTERVLAQAHLDIRAAMDHKATEDELKPLRKLVRGSQMRWDFVAANNGMGFHSPQECMRVLQASLDLAAQARVEAARVLARHGYTNPVAYPDYTTKAKAIEAIQPYLK